MQVETVEPLAEAPSEVVQQEAAPSSELPDQISEESPPNEETLSPEDRNKKLAKALERNKRKIGKLHAQTAQERESRQRLEQVVSELEKRLGPQQPQTIDENQFSNYGDYLKADNKMTAEQIAQKIVDERIAAFETKQQTQHQQAKWVETQQQSIADSSDKLSKQLPDFDAVLSSHAETIAEFPDHIKLLALSTPDVAIAAYQLAKEDALDDLADMTVEQAKSALEQAVKRGMIALNAKKISRAPEPMSSAKGTAGGVKSLERMSAHELMQWARSG